MTVVVVVTTINRMGPKHTREQLLEGALATAQAEGLSRLTFGRVAKQLGISDRMVAYYFPTVADLVTEVMVLVGVQLQASLGAALTGPAEDHLALAAMAWPVLARPEADPAFALFFEANGLAAAGREPYRELVTVLLDGWVAWVAEHLHGPPAQRRAEAEAAIALLDGLLLLRQLGGPDAAERAARRLGIRRAGGPAARRASGP